MSGHQTDVTIVDAIEDQTLKLLLAFESLQEKLDAILAETKKKDKIL